MHLYPQRWNVAAQVEEELKIVTYAIPPSYGETQKKKSFNALVCEVGLVVNTRSRRQCDSVFFFFC